MARKNSHNNLELVPRGYRINPDWNRNFREDQDKVTKVIDQILDMSVREYIGREHTMLQDVYFTKYWSWGGYCLIYKMKEDYDNLEVLFGAVLESTDDVLRWYDITEFGNFNVYIITPYRTFRLTYLDLLYEYVTMNHNRISFIPINNHPRIQQMKEWVTRYQEYDRYTRKTFLSNHPYSNIDRNGQRGELLRLRNDDRQILTQKYRGEGIRPGEYNSVMGGEQFYQQVRDQQRELMRGQMSLRWSDYETNNPCAEIELPNVTVKQRVSKLNKLLNKLKL
jgi:hypothetical protein